VQTPYGSGDFASVEEAARALSWTKPYVDEARAAVARGEFVSLEEHKAHNAALLASLER